MRGLTLIHNILKPQSHIYRCLAATIFAITTVQPSRLYVASLGGRVLVSIIWQIKSSVD